MQAQPTHDFRVTFLTYNYYSDVSKRLSRRTTDQDIIFLINCKIRCLEPAWPGAWHINSISYPFFGAELGEENLELSRLSSPAYFLPPAVSDTLTHPAA